MTKNVASFDVLENVLGHFEEVQQALEGLTFDFGAVIEALLETNDEGNTIFVCGNGGSSALASHFTQDLVKQGGLRAFCLSDNTPLVTAYANDDGYHTVFRMQLSRYANDGDMLFAISCSGESPNVIQAVRTAKLMNMRVVGMTGQKKNSLSKMADIVVPALSDNILVQEDLHAIYCHAIIRAINEMQRDSTLDR